MNDMTIAAALAVRGGPRLAIIVVAWRTRVTLPLFAAIGRATAQRDHRDTAPPLVNEYGTR